MNSVQPTKIVENKLRRKDIFSVFSFKKVLPCVAILTFMALMIAKPDFYIQSAQKGLALFATSVLPSLFPFYFFSLLLTKIGAAKTLSNIARYPVKLLFNAPKESSYIFFLSIMSGYPVGASTTYEMYSAGLISQKQARSISAFCSTSGPIFILGTVGSAMFNNLVLGVIILVSHYLGAILNGIVFRLRKKDEFNPQFSTTNILNSVDADSVISKSMASSTASMLMIGGYIVIAGMLIDTFQLTNFDSLIFSHFGESVGVPILAFVYGIIETTRGSLACASITYAPLKVALCCALISFGGVSINLQNYTYLSKCGVSMTQILARKIVQSVLSATIAFCIGIIIL